MSAETKQLVRACAKRELLNESVWLRRAIEAAAASSCQPEESAAARDQRLRVRVVSGTDDGLRGARIFVRLRPDDRMLLRERSAARGMPAATYASVLVRAHLRQLAPVPKAELVALKRSVAELSAIGRNVNQIAHAAITTGKISGPGREELRAFIKVCEGLRDHVKGLIKANVDSWEVGYADDR